MAERLTYDQFAERLGETFILRLDAERSVDLVLSHATRIADEPYDYAGRDNSRVPFSLLFLGPRDPILPQRIYRFDDEQLGAFEMFIVPIGRDDRGVEYEAIFT